MRRHLRVGLVLLAGAIGFAIPANANLRLVPSDIQWLNKQRHGVLQSTNANAPIDTLYQTLNVAGDVDTLIAEGVEKLVPFPAPKTAQGADSLVTLARLVLVSDSTVTPTMTGARVIVEGVLANSVTATGKSSVSPGSRFFHRVFLNLPAGAVYSIPIYQNSLLNTVDSTSVAGAGPDRGLGFATWRIVIHSAAGIAGRMRAFLSYYIDD